MNSDRFYDGYVDAIAFTYEEDWEDKDAQYSHELLDRCIGDCKAFWRENEDKIKPEYSYDAGINFWFTRNRHGAGFWDSPEVWGEYTDALTEAAHTFPELNAYDHNGLIYFA